MDKNVNALRTLASSPLLLDNPRAWRTYLGGSLLDALHGNAQAQDTHFPEEWIASTVSARNAGREMILDEGLSHLMETPDISLKELIEMDPASFLGQNHVAGFGSQVGVLIKLIDSSERLSIQVHPNKEKAKELFKSDYGKTECWHILGGRTIEGEKPSIYFGFKEGVAPDHWRHLFDVQDIPGMLDCLHHFEVSAGDTFLIEGGTPHAIGRGCFLAEIQEPTDYTVRVERASASGMPIADSMCHQGLGFERMFECFDFNGLSREETLVRWRIPAKPLRADKQVEISQVIGYEDTGMFRMEAITIHEGSLVVPPRPTFSVLYVLAGSGFLKSAEQHFSLRQGQQYFLPAAMGSFSLSGSPESDLKILHCFGPQTVDAGSL